MKGILAGVVAIIVAHFFGMVAGLLAVIIAILYFGAEYVVDSKKG
jgi:hypothetical protein